MRRPAKSPDKALSRPPFHLASAADDARQMWVFDRHDWQGRRVAVGTLAEVEALFSNMPGFEHVGQAPDVRQFLFPLPTGDGAIFYRRMARRCRERGYTRIGWERPEQ